MSRLSLVSRASAVVVALSVCLAAHLLRAEPLSVENLTPSQPDATKNVQEIADAAARFKVGDVPGTIELLKQAVQKYPDRLPPVQVFMAELFAGAQNAGAMQDALEKAVKEAPDDPEAYLMMGTNALRGGRTAEASMLLRKAEKLLATFKGANSRKDSLAWNIHAALAQTAGSMEDFAGVQKEAEAMLKVKPGNADALRALAQALFMQNKPEEALAKLREAAKVDAELLTPEAIMAQWYEGKDDRENATKNMIAALKANGNDLKTRLAAARWAFAIEQYGEAMKQAESALKLDPNSLDAKALCGNIALFQKDYPNAEKYLTAAHLQAPANFSITNNLALALVEQGTEAKKRLAFDYANLNARLYDRGTDRAAAAEAYSTYGWVLYQLERLDDADQMLNNAANSTRSLSPDTAYYIAKVRADRGQKEQAVKLLEQVVQGKGLFTKRDEAKALLQQLKQ